jgi:predicted DNA-binding transcriptional regulator AlpA
MNLTLQKNAKHRVGPLTIATSMLNPSCGGNMPLIDEPDFAGDTGSNRLEPAMPTQSLDNQRKPPRRVEDLEPLLTAEEVAKRLHVSTDWVWDHSSRRRPLLPSIPIGDGTLRYRLSKIEEFINERERMSTLRRKAG